MFAVYLRFIVLVLPGNRFKIQPLNCMSSPSAITYVSSVLNTNQHVHPPWLVFDVCMCWILLSPVQQGYFHVHLNSEQVEAQLSPTVGLPYSRNIRECELPSYQAENNQKSLAVNRSTGARLFSPSHLPFSSL